MIDMDNILFLHGWGGNERSFASVLPFFEGKYNCVCVYLPTEPGEVWTLEDYADTVLCELDKRGIQKAHIIAHSFGARVAVLLVGRQPERFGKLVLTGPAGLRPRLSIIRRLKIRLHKAGLVKGRGSADYRILSPTGKKTFQNVVNRDLSAEIARIGHSILIIWGDKDDAVKKYMINRWTKLACRVTIKVYKGCGHFCFLDKAARFILDTEEFLNAF